MPKPPKLTVLMTAYNAADFVEKSILSVLHQDYKDYEFLIINDGSTDNTQEILDRYAAQDGRVRVIQQKNIGLVASLNKGIGLAKGAYIARMDSDDLSMPQRLSRQVAFLDSHPGVVIVAGGFEIIDEEENFLDRVFVPLKDRDIRRCFTMKNVFGHASVMYRREAAVKAGLYHQDVGPAEDLDLWMRMGELGELAALPYSLMRYRINQAGISKTRSKEQMHYTQVLTQHYRDKYPIVPLSRAEIITTSREYLNSGPGIFFGTGLKMLFLLDNAQLGVKLIRYRKPIQGMRQLFNVASTGRTGLRAVWIRFKHLGPASFRLAVLREPSLASLEEKTKDEIATKITGGSP